MLALRSCPACPRSRRRQGPPLLLSPCGHRHAGVGRRRSSKAYPELHEEKGVGRSPFKELLETTLPLGELVVNLADVHGFEVGVAVAGARLADVHEQVLIVLWTEKNWSEGPRGRRGRQTRQTGARSPASGPEQGRHGGGLFPLW